LNSNLLNSNRFKFEKLEKEIGKDLEKNPGNRKPAPAGPAAQPAAPSFFLLFRA
jgi:hypothetical protein